MDASNFESKPLSLTKLINPASIAVVGASQDTRKIGGDLIANLKGAGYKGAIYPINPKYAEIQQLRCYPDLSSVQKPIDLAVVIVSADKVVQIIEQCGAAHIPFAVVLSSGFGEIGLKGERLQQALNEAIRQTGVHVIGPNTVGFMNVAERVFCGFAPGFRNYTLSPGPVGMVTQSGGYGFSIVGLAQAQGINFSHVISMGNECDVSTPDVLDYMLHDPGVEVLVAYIEGVRDGRRLLEVGRQALKIGKPILCWKVGNSSAGRAAAASHTANLTAPYEFYRAAFDEGGFIQVRDVDDLVDIARGFLGRRLPKGRNVGIATTSGGSGVVLAEYCDEAGLSVPPLSETCRNDVAPLVPAFASLSNPLDLTAEIGPDATTFNRVLKRMVMDESFDQIIARYGAVQAKNAPEWAAELSQIASDTDKPLFVAWSRVPDLTAPALRVLQDNRVPWFVTPTRCVTALAALSAFAEKRRKEAAIASIQHAAPAVSRFDFAAGQKTLGEHAAKAVLREYGVPVTKEFLYSLTEIQTLSKSPLRFPVALKIESADIPHKTELGAVRLNVRSLKALKTEAACLYELVAAKAPTARIDGVLVQEMCSGLEVLVGAVCDEYFGPLVVVGLGGIYAEVLKDTVRRFAPFPPAVARDMLMRLKASAILKGYRNHPPLDVEALASAVSRISYLIHHYQGQIREIDVNPLFVREAGKGVVAADALIVLGSATSQPVSS